MLIDPWEIIVLMCTGCLLVIYGLVIVLSLVALGLLWTVRAGLWTWRRCHA